MERGDGADHHRGGEDYWHSGDDPKVAQESTASFAQHRVSDVSDLKR
jgi:hypothetical protein